MPDPHYVRDYRQMAAWLIANRPLDQAMADAVGGGDFNIIGDTERDLVERAGLRMGQSVIDIGCGSGRLTRALADAYGDGIRYLGTDVVPELLSHARIKAASSYRFVLHTELSVPATTNTIDMIAVFSVLTHLSHAEGFIYLEDMQRALKPGGAIVLSFLESAPHWGIFQQSIREARENQPGVMVTFTEWPMIEHWARVLGLQPARLPAPEFQSVAILRKLIQQAS